jgi:hypothetical protein
MNQDHVGRPFQAAPDGLERPSYVRNFHAGVIRYPAVDVDEYYNID